MTIICVDRKPLALRKLLRQVCKLVRKASVHGCRGPDEALRTAEREGCDVLLTGIDLQRRHTDGFAMAEKIQKINPWVNIIFFTERAEDWLARRAYRIHASGFVVEPYTMSRLAEEFANLRFPVETGDLVRRADIVELKQPALQMVSGGLGAAVRVPVDDPAPCGDHRSR